MNSNSAILEISANRLIYNYSFFSNINKNTIAAATIKANAYGLGDLEIFKILYKAGCRNFFVATLNEGIKLRTKYKIGNIYILNGTEKNQISLFKKYNLIPIINDFNESKLIKNNNIIYGLHVDTGINRLGFNYDKVNEKILADKNLKIVISHLSSADEINNPYNNFQKEKFDILINKFIKRKILVSLSNSHGSIISHQYLFNLIRPGIGIYGGHHNKKLKKYLKPVVKLKGKVLQIKEVLKNEFIGYNQTYITKKKTYIAIIGIGYADGVSRLLSNKGFVYFKKEKFKILGRVSMDTITINITKKHKIIKIGNYVEIINYEHGVDKIAAKCKTISNEILTAISSRVKRVYV